MRRPRLSTAQRTDLWLRWKRGESLSAIARALDRVPSAIAYLVRQQGGIVRPERQRAPRVLRLDEREEISRALALGESRRSVSRRLQRAPSTICREINRHGGPVRYRAAAADAAAWRDAQRPKACRLAEHPTLRRLVASQLAAKWSPEQIAGWLRVTYPDDPTMHVSHETIYRSLFVQSRGVLKKALVQHLRRCRLMRRSQHAAFTVATDVQVYFCDPQSPWQRGSNENTNGLLRQYFPKGADLAGLSQGQLNRVAKQLNQRPRKTLGYKTPADMLATFVASTG